MASVEDLRWDLEPQRSLMQELRQQAPACEVRALQPIQLIADGIVCDALEVVWQERARVCSHGVGHPRQHAQRAINVREIEDLCSALIECVELAELCLCNQCKIPS